MSAAAIAPPPGVKAQTNGTKPSNPPNQTLYISNIPDNKIQKDDVRRALYALFSTYGPVLDVVALRTGKMRGQAHVVYRDVQTSTQAMRALQGFEFFGKEIRISYGKGKSNIISRLDGSASTPESKTEPAKTSEATKSIFAAPPGPGGPPSKPPNVAAPIATSIPEPAVAPQGTKRPREDEDEAEAKRPREEENDEGGAAPMEEDEDDEGGAMEMDESDEE